MMASDPSTAGATHTLDELCALTQLPKRTVRYYIQMGLMDRPIGETRAARYNNAHIRRLLQIRQLSSAGFSLERIRSRLDAPIGSDVYARLPGTVEQWTRLIVDDGLELNIDPDRAVLSAEQVRSLFRELMVLYAKIRASDAATGADNAA